MAGRREERDAARLALHAEMQVAAVYIVENERPRPVSVRVHTEFAEVGGVKGTSFAYAERQDTKPRVIFLYSEVPKPKNKAIISVKPGEAYRIDNVLPPENVTVTAEVTAISPAKTEGLPVPGDNLDAYVLVLSLDDGRVLVDGNSAYRVDA